MMASTKKQKRIGGGPFESLRALKSELPESRQKKPANAPKQPRPDQAEDDANQFHRLYAGVTPLEKSGGRVPRVRVPRSQAAEQATRRGRGVAEAEADAVQARLRGLIDTGARFEVADDGRRVEGRRVDLPADLLRRLRRGLHPIDARLDLHGMSVQEARGQLELFLRTMRARGERCVLVIVGKGGHSPQGFGVLRGEIAAWLSQGASSQHVTAFASAREQDGGEGAVYVLLRR